MGSLRRTAKGPRPDQPFEVVGVRHDGTKEIIGWTAAADGGDLLKGAIQWPRYVRAFVRRHAKSSQRPKAQRLGRHVRELGDYGPVHERTECFNERCELVIYQGEDGFMPYHEGAGTFCRAKCFIEWDREREEPRKGST